jgi:hypothetical protein
VWGEFSLAVSFRNIEDHSTWTFAGVHDHNSDRARRLLWDGWIVYPVGGTCLGVLGVILMSLVSPVKGWEKPA